MQNVKQLLNIGKVQAGGRLVENIQRLPGTALRQFSAPASRAEPRRRKASSPTDKTDIGQSHVHQRLRRASAGTHQKNSRASSMVAYPALRGWSCLCT